MDRISESKMYYQKHKVEILQKCKEKYLKNGPRPYTLCKDVMLKYRKSLKGRYNAWIGRARRSRIEHSVSYDSWLYYVTDACHYCYGTLPSQGCGVDRKNPKLGYINDNIVACCKRCNTMKNNFLTYEEMKVVGNAMYEHWLKQGNHLKEGHDEDTNRSEGMSKSAVYSAIRRGS